MDEEVKTPAEETAAKKTYLDTFNANRESQIGNMYNASLNANLSNMESNYNANLANMQADRDKIAQSYQQQGNALGAEYERMRRNNNMKAAGNGLNTGANSQMDLAQMNAYMSGRSKLGASQAEQTAAADRNITNLTQEYNSAVSEAKANNDYQKAAALLDEYADRYARDKEQATELAKYGIFSGYEGIYGPEKAQQMLEAWISENPDLAYNTGKIAAERYHQITGKYPAGYSAPSSGGGGGGYYGGGSGGGYDADIAKLQQTINQNSVATGTGKVAVTGTANAQTTAAAQKLYDYNAKMAAHYSR